MRYFIVLLAVVHLCAGAEIFARVDPLTGHVTYTNMPIEKTPVEALPPVRGDAKPTLHVVRSRASGSTSQTPPGAKTFPTVSVAEQRLRDVDRYQILRDELTTEKAAYESARMKKAGAEVLARHQINIASLERELLRVK